MARPDERNQRSNGATTDRAASSRQLGDLDDPDSSLWQGLAMEVGGERVVLVVGLVRAHSASISLPRGRGRRHGAVGALPASQRATAARRPGAAAARSGRAGPCRSRLRRHATTEHDLGRRADQDQLVDLLQLVQRDAAARERDFEVVDQLKDEPPGQSGQDLVPLGRAPRAVRRGPRSATCAWPRSPARRHRPAPPRTRLALRRLDRQNIGQQVGRLDVAPLPAQVWLADHRSRRSGAAGPWARRHRAGR